MTDRSDRPNLHVPDDEHAPDDDGLHPAGEGLSETPIHATYEAIALHDDLARQLEEVIVAARAWARADDTPESLAVADALAEIYERVGEPTGS